MPFNLVMTLLKCLNHRNKNRCLQTVLNQSKGHRPPPNARSALQNGFVYELKLTIKSPGTPIGTDDSIKTNHFPGRWMPPTALYERLSKHESVFVLDLRPRDAYLEKRLNYKSQANLSDASNLPRR